LFQFLVQFHKRFVQLGIVHGRSSFIGWSTVVCLHFYNPVS
jgi:hypothetical protein